MPDALLLDPLPGRRARSACGVDRARAWSAGSGCGAGRSSVSERLPEKAGSPGSRCETGVDVCSSVGWRAARRRVRGDRRRLRRWLRGRRPPRPALRAAQVAEPWRHGFAGSGSVDQTMAGRRADVGHAAAPGRHVPWQARAAGHCCGRCQRRDALAHPRRCLGSEALEVGGGVIALACRRWCFCLVARGGVL